MCSDVITEQCREAGLEDRERCWIEAGVEDRERCWLEKSRGNRDRERERKRQVTSNEVFNKCDDLTGNTHTCLQLWRRDSTK